MKSSQRWDIFCTVIDNYGDIAICWRLARQLTSEHGISVRLWVDDLKPLAALQPDIRSSLSAQHAAGVEVRRWDKSLPGVEAADVVIEAFACELPENYLHAMSSGKTRVLWINLDYLSAESWIEDCHGLPSPHPTLGLTKYFFFPGFSAGTGGLLLEADYSARKAAFNACDFRDRLGLPARDQNEIVVSLFAYDNPALPALLQAWEGSDHTIRCLIPENLITPAVRTYFGLPDTGHASSIERNALKVHFMPFLSQDDYDLLLWLCDLNFVRGEDSFVRAQWAAKPFVWQIYPQPDLAHRKKLDAFLDRFLMSFNPDAAEATRTLWLAWNGFESLGTTWTRFGDFRTEISAGTQDWAHLQVRNGDLAGNLVNFAAKTLA